MVDGVGDAVVLMLVVPTLEVLAAVVVVLAYGVVVATTDVVETGLTIVHGQLVIVKVVDSVTV